jgi:hypothetical protein
MTLNAQLRPYQESQSADSRVMTQPYQLASYLRHWPSRHECNCLPASPLRRESVTWWGLFTPPMPESIVGRFFGVLLVAGD